MENPNEKLANLNAVQERVNALRKVIEQKPEVYQECFSHLNQTSNCEEPVSVVFDKYIGWGNWTKK